MTETDPPSRYQVVFSVVVERLLDELSEQANARGDGPVFAAALAEFRQRLAIYPQFGHPHMDLVVGGGQIRTGIIRPLVMRYGIHEDTRIVFCVAPPILLPMDKPDCAEDE